MSIIKSVLILLALYMYLPFSSRALAVSEEEEKYLYMYYREEDLVETPTRAPKHLSDVAENMTVIKAKDIEEMNAHTLADILYNITGVEIDTLTTPGNQFFPSIQGSNFNQVLVLMDGIILNNLYENLAYIGTIPVQHIRQVEIIKGPASSVWGSSLGGVINIITKPGGPADAAGTISASYGEKNTWDYRAEIYGKNRGISYYLSGGGLSSDGFNLRTRTRNNNFYSKVGYDASQRLSFGFSVGYIRTDDEYDKYLFPTMRIIFDSETLFSSLNAKYSMDSNTELAASLRILRRNMYPVNKDLGTWTDLIRRITHERKDGGSVRLSTRLKDHAIVVGADLDSDELETRNFTSRTQSRETRTMLAAYVSDTIEFHKFAITPGIRYDKNGDEDQISPSLGITYKLGDNTVLRVTASEGFSTPAMGIKISIPGSEYIANPNAGSEKIRSVQAGFETTAIKYLYLKGTLFRHRVRDALEVDLFEGGKFAYANKGRVKRDGFEFEVRTVPVYNTSLSAGVAYIDAKDMNTGQKIELAAKNTYDVGVHYEYKGSFMAMLRGHYVKWNNDQESSGGKFDSFIWDLNLSKKVYAADKSSAEIFFAAHNLFNNSQHQLVWKNPGRWVEGGLRFKF